MHPRGGQYQDKCMTMSVETAVLHQSGFCGACTAVKSAVCWYSTYGLFSFAATPDAAEFAVSHSKAQLGPSILPPHAGCDLLVNAPSWVQVIRLLSVLAVPCDSGRCKDSHRLCVTSSEEQIPGECV